VSLPQFCRSCESNFDSRLISHQQNTTRMVNL
jgi:hypothetical protein